MSQPMGTGPGRAFGAASNQVASAATSDEPNRFNSTRPGNRSKNRSAKSPPNASPLLAQCESRGRRAPRSAYSSSTTRSSDGTNTIRVTPPSASALTSRPGSFTTGSAIRTVATPCSNGPKNLPYGITKLKTVFWQQRSPSVKGYRRHIHRSRLSVARCCRNSFGTARGSGSIDRVGELV